MHPIFHSIKRVHLRTQYVMGQMAGDLGLTPARFDMLTAIRNAGPGIAQCTLRRVLAVSAAVVSRMLRALEERGLVRREPHRYDRRTRWVTLTYSGDELTTDAHAEFLLWNPLSHNMARALVLRPAATVSNIPRGDAAMRHAYRTLGLWREKASDTSTLVYPGYLENGERDPAHALEPWPWRWPRRRARRRGAGTASPAA